MVRLLLEHGANVYVKSIDGSIDGCTALHEAAAVGHEAIVRLLLECKADIYEKNNYGRTEL
jgi:ankyrin repeat protein